MRPLGDPGNGDGGAPTATRRETAFGKVSESDGLCGREPVVRFQVRNTEGDPPRTLHRSGSMMTPVENGST